MLLNSFSFLGFFALLTVVYYSVPRRFRWWLLLVSSYYFYSAFQLAYLVLLAYATAVAYMFGRLVEGGSQSRHGKLWLGVGVLAQLSVLAVFKYADFFLESVQSILAPFSIFQNALAMPRLDWLLPVGLSFFTFSCLSYIIDCYRGKLPAERHLGHLAVYVAFFPKLVAGPIERATNFLPQLREGVTFDPVRVTFGLQMLLWGLFKKVVIADRLAEFVDAGFTNTAFQSPVTVLISVYFYAFQIYCDFSGYSDMAIGLAAILGFTLNENFRRPYLSRNVAEFWSKRWHISLANWFRDYLYIPLGGSRVPRLHQYVNVLAVFAVSGLWHGASWTFVIWGAINGFYQVIWIMLAGLRRRLAAVIPETLWTGISVLLTFHLMVLAWVFFRADTIKGAVAIFDRVWGALPKYPLLLRVYSWTPEFWLSLSLILILIIVECFDEVRSIFQRISALPLLPRWGIYYLMIACLLIIGRWSGAKFVYMQF